MAVGCSTSTVVGHEEYKYIALGDSIAKGYKLDNPEQNSYPSLIANELPTINGGRSVNFENYAVTGMTSTALLTLLTEDAVDFDGANLVTTCIGANNLLKPLNSAFREITEEYGINDGSVEFDKFGELLSALNTFLETKEMTAAFEAGIEEFVADFEKIISIVKSKAPNALIVVMTIYSPYKDFNLSLPYLGKALSVGTVSDKWVYLLNEQIIALSEKCGCLTVDTFEAFASENDCVNATIGLVPPRFSYDPHPTLKGHELIANLHIERLKEYFANNNAVACHSVMLLCRIRIGSLVIR